MPGPVLARLGDSAPRGADVAPALRERDVVRRAAVLAAPRPGIGEPGAVPAAEAVPLTRLPRNATGIVAGVRVSTEDDAAHERMALRLMEIGFIQGAQVRVVAFGQPGNDPIGVRVGGRGGMSSFALRREEAACVWVWVS